MPAEIGLIGLGVMGSALALNIAEKGHRIAVWNREGTAAFMAGAGALADRIVPAATLDALLAAIRPPRAVILLIPAGAPVDAMIAALRPRMAGGDILLDLGNSDYHDTERRSADAAAQGWQFMGAGVSGGEEGARHGPAIMGGGPRAAWDRVAPVLTDIAARAEDGTPCATWLGPGGAGHFVKTVHNGIEYADMQMIAEVYGIMRDGLGMGAAAIADVFARWNGGVLRSYLVAIAAEVARAADPETGQPMLDVILDAAGQKGTGRWTAIEGQNLAVPVPVIEAAVAARNVSARVAERAAGEAAFGAAPGPVAVSETDLECALIAGKILCYAQGFQMLAAASDLHGWDIPLAGAARVWRAGCIIRSDMLNAMATALEAAPGTSLTLAPAFADRLRATHDGLRRVVAAAAAGGHPVPALAAGLMWFDAMRTARGTANMIQAQRDYFGAHGFVRRDGRPGAHGPWAGKGAA